MRFEQFAAPTGCLSYLVGDERAGVAAAIDPPNDPTPILDAAQRLGLRITLVMETHTHADHISGARVLAAKTGAKLLLPAASGATYPHERIVDGRDVRVGDLRLRALATPGHTRDAMCFVLDDRAIVGDTLLVGTAGRADFYKEGPEELYHSIFDKLLKLRDELALYPCHFGPNHGLPMQMSTTLGHERRVNEALTQATKEDFIKYMTEGWPPKPKDWEAVVAANTRA